MTKAQKQALEYDPNLDYKNEPMEPIEEKEDCIDKLESLRIADFIAKEALMEELESVLWLTKAQNSIGPFVKEQLVEQIDKIFS